MQLFLHKTWRNTPFSLEKRGFQLPFSLEKRGYHFAIEKHAHFQIFTKVYSLNNINGRSEFQYKDHLHYYYNLER